MTFSNLETRQLFPTPLFIATLPTDTSTRIHQALVPVLRTKAATEPTANITNIGGWQSDTRIMEWGGEPVHTIVNAMRDIINQATLDLHAKDTTTAIEWKTYGWANINRKGHLNTAHTHPGSYWSASYYVQTDDIEKDSSLGGEFQILDPRGTLPITYRPQLRIGVEGFLSCGGHELIKPKAGQCLIFPSWLPHAVMPYMGDGERISLAFNFSV
jgi:uncharacterized protein (TIGR02466 family)